MKKLLILALFFGMLISCKTTPNSSSSTSQTQTTAKPKLKQKNNKPKSKSEVVAAALPPASSIKKRPRNVILLIGDGMGLTQISAGMYSNGNKLELEQFPWVGLHKSYSSNNLVTDSAAGATAFSSGVKTYNGAIGVDPDTNHVVTILEQAETNGMATGLVATSTIVHATPASFIAHVPSRRMYEKIAEAFVTTDIDLFIGGGRQYFERRKDDRNLSEELKAKGFQVFDFAKEGDLNSLKWTAEKPFAYYTSDADPLPVAQGRDYLAPASKLACEFLDKRSNGDGFFLMIEGAQIDWGGHANDSEYIISEMIDFDKAIGRVLDFAKKDGETLVIVTADHETGGYAINPGSTQDSIIGVFTSTYHTAALIPVFAFGPGAEVFSGIYENTSIYDRMNLLMFGN